MILIVRGTWINSDRKENGNEAVVVQEIEFLPVSRLSEVVGFLNDEQLICRAQVDLDRILHSDPDHGVDLVEVSCGFCGGFLDFAPLDFLDFVDVDFCGFCLDFG